LWAVILGLGLALTGPLAAAIRGEDEVNRDLAAGRTSAWNTITFFWSHIGNTEIVIGTCLLVSALVFWRTRDWRFALVPVLALLLEAIIFGTVSTLVGRARPPVSELDLAPPTASYPSGHVGGTTALFLSFALMALRIGRTWLRRAVVVICLTVPVLVGFARLYRGMHHVSDVAAGLVNGIACALISYGWYYRHRESRTNA
jgi:undecaprenyl-diphosphatase